MMDERMPGSLEIPNNQQGVINSTNIHPLCNRRTTHTTIATVSNDHYISNCTLEIRSESKFSAIYSKTVHWKKFDIILKLDNTTVMIYPDQLKISHSKDIPEATGHKTAFTDCCICKVVNHTYLFFKLDSTRTIFQIEYGNKCNGSTVFLKVNKFHSQVESSIGINPNLTLRKTLREKKI